MFSFYVTHNIVIRVVHNMQFRTAHTNSGRLDVFYCVSYFHHPSNNELGIFTCDVLHLCQ